jgi:hypothetical protein
MLSVDSLTHKGNLGVSNGGTYAVNLAEVGSLPDILNLPLAAGGAAGYWRPLGGVPERDVAMKRDVVKSEQIIESTKAEGSETVQGQCQHHCFSLLLSYTLQRSPMCTRFLQLAYNHPTYVHNVCVCVR